MEGQDGERWRRLAPVLFLATDMNRMKKETTMKNIYLLTMGKTGYNFIKGKGRMCKENGED